MTREIIEKIATVLGVKVSFSDIPVSATANELKYNPETKKMVKTGKSETATGECLLATPEGKNATYGIFTLLNKASKNKIYLSLLVKARGILHPETKKTSKAKSAFVVD